MQRVLSAHILFTQNLESIQRIYIKPNGVHHTFSIINL